LGHAPSAPQVLIEPIFEQALEGIFITLFACAPQRRLLCILLLVEPRRLEHRLRDVGVVKRFPLFQRAIQCRPHQRHIHKVIEVAGLERSILPVIGETHQLFGGFVHVFVFTQLDNRRVLATVVEVLRPVLLNLESFLNSLRSVRS
jgi:hypothetical protein